MLKAVALLMVLLARGDGDLLPEGSPAPEILARGADNRSWGQDFAGRITIVDFSTTWCPRCREALAGEDKLMAAFGERVQLVIVDVKEEPALVRAFFARGRTPLGATVVIDTSGATARAWHVTAFPTTFLIDKRGVVRDSWSGWGDDTLRVLSEMILVLENDEGRGQRTGKKRKARAAATRASFGATEDERARKLGVEVLH